MPPARRFADLSYGRPMPDETTIPDFRTGCRSFTPSAKRSSRESLNKGVNSEFDFSNVTLKQPSPGSQPEIGKFAPKTAEFR